MAFIDSHCHINFPELAANMSDVLAQMRQNEVVSALCISVNLADFPQVLALAEQYPCLLYTSGVCESAAQGHVAANRSHCDLRLGRQVRWQPAQARLAHRHRLQYLYARRIDAYTDRLAGLGRFAGGFASGAD